MKLKRIFVVHNRYIDKGGEDICVSNEINALRESGLEVRAFLPHSGETPHVSIRAGLAPFGASLEGHLEADMRRFRPDIVHVHNLYPLLSPRLFKAARQMGIRTVLTLHNYRPLCLNGLCLTPSKETCERCASGNYAHGIVRGCYRHNRFQSLGLSMHLWLARSQKWYGQVDRFIAPSQFIKSKYVEYDFPADKLVVQGHFLAQFPNESPAKPEPYVLYMGRLSEEKGVRWLLNTFLDARLPLKLVIAGTGPLQGEVQKACGKNIEYLGFMDGEVKERCLKSATALLVPSECYENFPLAVAEANAWGIPALVSRFGALPEMVESGENGASFGAKDSESFWQALKSIQQTADPTAYRANCQQFARVHYSKDLRMKARIALYEDLISSGSAARLAPLSK